MSNEKFRVKFGLQVGDSAANIDGTTGDITTSGDLIINGNSIKSNGGNTAIELNGFDISTGDIKLNGGDIRSSDDSVAISVSGANATIAGDLKLNNNIIKGSAGTTALTLSGADVAVAGDLTVTGNDIKGSAGQTALTISGNDVQFADAVTALGTITGNNVVAGPISLNSTGININYGNLSTVCAVMRATNKVTTTSTTATDLVLGIIDQQYASIDFIIQARSNNEWQVVKGMLLLDGVTDDTYMNIYSDLKTSGDLFTVSANITGTSDVQLLVTSASATSTTYSCVWTGINSQS